MFPYNNSTFSETASRNVRDKYAKRVTTTEELTLNTVSYREVLHRERRHDGSISPSSAESILSGLQ